MKKTTTTKKLDWKETMTTSTDNIILSLEDLLHFLQKNKKTINKDIKSYGVKASGASELFNKLILNVDKKLSEIWDIVEEE